MCPTLHHARVLTTTPHMVVTYGQIIENSVPKYAHFLLKEKKPRMVSVRSCLNYFTVILSLPALEHEV